MSYGLRMRPGLREAGTRLYSGAHGSRATQHMAIRKIARMGHPVLRRPTTAVSDVSDPEIQRLIADMKETLADAQGVGLAAPQVYATRSVLMFFVPPSRAAGDANDEGVPLTVLINPEIEPIGDAQVGGWEGCLSIPGLQGYVPRWQRIRYRGLDETGAPDRMRSRGLPCPRGTA